jgi:hypothetical protein
VIRAGTNAQRIRPPFLSGGVTSPPGNGQQGPGPSSSRVLLFCSLDEICALPYNVAVHHPSGHLGNDRQQRICTPPELLEPVYELYGGPIDLDPFDDEDSIVRARTKIRWPAQCGFASKWHGRVFANPPFKRLGEALQKCLRSVGTDCDEVVLLCPFRSHRRHWWPFWWAQSVCYLRPIRFLGWDDGFPIPCVFVYFGPRAGVFERCVRHLGVVRPLTPWGPRPMMAPMDISQEYESRAKAVLIDTVQAHPDLSIDQIVEKLHLSEDDAARLRATPLSQLVKMVDEPEIDAAPAPTTGVNGSARPRAKRKAPPRVGSSAKATDATTAVTKYVDKIRKGTKFSTSEIMEKTGLGRKTVLRVIDTLSTVKKSGRGRAAFLLKK